MEEKRNVKKRILITVVILFLIQLLAGIPTPGVNLNYFKSLLEQNTTAGLFDVLSGNGLSNLSITMLSITPYITASYNFLPLLFDHWKNCKEVEK